MLVSLMARLKRYVHINIKCHLYKHYLLQPVRLLAAWVKGHTYKAADTHFSQVLHSRACL